MKRAKTNPLEKALEYARADNASFEKTFARVTGSLDFAVDKDPEAFCRITDVHEIFVRLFDMSNEKTETPGAATPRESR